MAAEAMDVETPPIVLAPLTTNDQRPLTPPSHQKHPTSTTPAWVVEPCFNNGTGYDCGEGGRRVTNISQRHPPPLPSLLNHDPFYPYLLSLLHSVKLPTTVQTTIAAEAAGT